MFVYLFIINFLQIVIQGANSHLIIGKESSPFQHKVIITLTGQRSDLPTYLSSDMKLGSKAIGVFGNVGNHGNHA